MKLLKKMVYTKVFMVLMAIWFMPISHGDEEFYPSSRRIDNSAGWFDARATFYGDMTGAETHK